MYVRVCYIIFIRPLWCSETLSDFKRDICRFDRHSGFFLFLYSLTRQNIEFRHLTRTPLKF